MSDQADQLRQLVQQVDSTDGNRVLPLVVTVSGGKRGVGASTVAMELTRSLVEHGCRAAMIDADLHRADATNRAGIESPVAHSLSDILVGRRTVSEVVQKSHTGFFVLPSCEQSGGQPEFSTRGQQRLVASLHWLQQRVDAVVVDAGTGATPWSQWWWQVSRQILVVTTADDVAVMDTYAMLKIAAHGGTLSHVKILVNRCESRSLAESVHQRIGRACFRFLGELVPAERYLPEDVALQAGAPRATNTWRENASEYRMAIRPLAASITTEVDRVSSGHCLAVLESSEI